MYVVDLDGSSLKAIDKGAKRYGEGNPVYVQFGRGEFIGIKKKTGQIASKETARDVYMRASLTNPRFKLLPKSGETFTIVGARPPVKA